MDDYSDSASDVSDDVAEDLHLETIAVAFELGRLPPELRAKVILDASTTAASYSPSAKNYGHPRQHWTLLLVCKEFDELIAPSVWGDIVLEKRKMTPSGMRFLIKTVLPRYGRFIKHAIISRNGNRLQEEGEEVVPVHPGVEELSKGVLAGMPNLTSLSLDSYLYNVVATSPHLESPTSLKVDALIPALIPDVSTLITRCLNLTSLGLFGYTWDPDSRLLVDAVISLASLTTLSIVCGVNAVEAFATADWNCPMEHLTLYDQISLPILRTFVSNFSTTLVHLALQLDNGAPRWSEDPGRVAPLPLPRLTSLGIFDYISDGSFLQVPLFFSDSPIKDILWERQGGRSHITPAAAPTLDVARTFVDAHKRTLKSVKMKLLTWDDRTSPLAVEFAEYMDRLGIELELGAMVGDDSDEDDGEEGWSEDDDDDAEESSGSEEE